MQKDQFADFAVDALLVLAIMLIQMYQRLRVGCRTHLLTDQSPLADDAVILRRNALHPFQHLLCPLLIMMRQRIRIAIRQERIDEQNIYRTLAYR